MTSVLVLRRSSSSFFALRRPRLKAALLHGSPPGDLITHELVSVVDKRYGPWGMHVFRLRGAGIKNLFLGFFVAAASGLASKFSGQNPADVPAEV